MAANGPPRLDHQQDRARGSNVTLDSIREHGGNSLAWSNSAGLEVRAAEFGLGRRLQVRFFNCKRNFEFFSRFHNSINLLTNGCSMMRLQLSITIGTRFSV